MNLIEELGGYERAKDIVNKSPCKTYTYHNHPYQKGYIRCCGGDNNEYFYVSDIDDALLEYRREHGIFEVGDKVVSDDSGMIMIFGDGCEKWFCLRHATALEIQAGHRLP